MAIVLIVEDTNTEAAIIDGTLQGAGFATVRAISSEDAKTKLNQQKPDLIVLDIVLPGESGFELCRALKEEPDTKHIPIILCSTKDSEMDKFWGKKQGASSYLTKPIVADDLIRTPSCSFKGSSHAYYSSFSTSVAAVSLLSATANAGNVAHSTIN